MSGFERPDTRCSIHFGLNVKQAQTAGLSSERLADLTADQLRPHLVGLFQELLWGEPDGEPPPAYRLHRHTAPRFEVDEDTAEARLTLDFCSLRLAEWRMGKLRLPDAGE